MTKNNPYRKSESEAIGKQCPTTGDRAKRRVSSTDLLGACRELLIEHLGEVYVLRHTSKGKLILTK